MSFNANDADPHPASLEVEAHSGSGGENKSEKKQCDFEDYAYCCGAAEDEINLLSDSKNETEQLASVSATFVNLLKGNVGAGFLAMPYAFSNIGLVGGVLGTVVVSVVVLLSMRLLVKCKVHLRGQGFDEDSLTYSKIGQHGLGNIGRYLILAGVFMSQIGTCTAYLIFFASVVHSTWPEISRYSAIILALACVYPLVVVRNLANLQWTSFLGCALTTIVVGVIITYEVICIEGSPTRDHPQDFVAFIQDVQTVPRFFGITMFAIEGITVILPLEQSMAKKELFLPTLYGAMTCVTLLLTVFGGMGYYVFGTVTSSMVTANMPGNSYVTSLECLLVLSLVVTFPIQLYPITQVVDNWLIPTNDSESSTSESLRWCIRALICIFVGHLAFCVPHFGDVLAVVGGLAVIGIGVVFPCILYIVFYKGQLHFIELGGLVLLTAASIALSILVTSTALWDLVDLGAARATNAAASHQEAHGAIAHHRSTASAVAGVASNAVSLATHMGTGTRTLGAPVAAVPP